jgi:SOS-response transcriptional repressor LexA
VPRVFFCLTVNDCSLYDGRMSFETRVQQIQTFYQARRRIPSFREIAAMTGLRSKNAVSKLVRQMIMRELITQDAQGRLIPARRWREVPFVGLVEAGFPSPADEQLLETLSLEEWLIRNREATYLLRVRGDSMVDAGILPGDVVLVERGSEPHPGDIVIAQIDGEWTLKYFRIPTVLCARGLTHCRGRESGHS